MRTTPSLRRARGVLSLIAGALLSLSAQAVVFSLDSRSAPAGVGPADILQSFGGGGAPTVVATAAGLGLRPGDDLTGLHLGALAAITLWFSVDRESAGLPGTAVAGRAPAAADVFAAGFLGSVPAGQNALAIRNDQLGLDADANIDAAFWFTWQPERAFLFTLAPGSPTLARIGATGATPGDILIHHPDNTMAVFKAAAELGLEADDVIDAFQLAEGATPGSFEVVFSLAPGSPTLARLGASPADILVARNATAMVQTQAWEIGLLPGDNLDVIGGTFDCFTDPLADCKIPEPPALPLVAAALALAAVAARTAGRRR